MLIDQVLNDPVVGKAGLLSADLRGRLSKTPKFVLQRDFAMAADEFSSTGVANLDKVIGLARLPYPECWLEVAQADRELFANAPMESTDGRCARVGWLLTQTDQVGSWSAMMFFGRSPRRRRLPGSDCRRPRRGC